MPLGTNMPIKFFKKNVSFRRILKKLSAQIQKNSCLMKFGSKVLLRHFRKKASFCPDIYLYKYSDVLFAKMSPLEHYVMYGRREGRNCLLSNAVKVLYTNKIPSIGIVNRYSNHLGFKLMSALYDRRANIKGAGCFNFILSNSAWIPISSLGSHEIISSGDKIYFINDESINKDPTLSINDKGMEEVYRICCAKNIISVHSFSVRDARVSPKLNVSITYSEGNKKSYSIKNSFNRTLIISDAQNENDPSRIYRCKIKSDQYLGSGIHSLVLADPQITKILESAEVYFPAFIASFSCIIFQRKGLSSAVHALMKNAKMMNIKILYDVDDLIFKPWRLEETAAIRSGYIAPNDEKYRESLRSKMRLMLQADGVIVSTPFLKREIQTMGPETYILPNKVEPDVFLLGKLNIEKNEHRDIIKIIYMSGSATHHSDARMIIPIMDKLVEFYQGKLSLTVLGEVDVNDWAGIDCKIIPKVPRQKMFGLLSDFDISLVPLEKTSFNLGKSSLKFIEASSVGVITVASPLYEFKRDIYKSGAGRVFYSDEELRNIIMDYILDPDELRRQKLMAYEYSKARYAAHYLPPKFNDWVENLN